MNHVMHVMDMYLVAEDRFWTQAAQVNETEIHAWYRSQAQHPMAASTTLFTVPATFTDPSSSDSY